MLRIVTMKKFSKVITVCLLSFSLMATANAKAPPMLHDKANNPELSNMLQKIMPAVVNITAQGDAPMQSQTSTQKQKGSALNPYNPFERFQAVGSGVIVDAGNGYIVTNAHVIRHADVLIVSLSDGRRLKARKMGEDPATDIAVLQVYAKHLQAIPLANSNALKVGDFVAAIGNPFGLQQTVTSGMVSALNRSLGIEGPLGYENFIQTDASINPGNSGGALIDIEGKLVGINTAILAPLGGNIGIGFAIPSNMVANVTNQLVKYGKVQRGMLGIMVQDLTPDLADAFKIPDAKGALVTQVTPGSPAEKIGLKAKDVVQSIDKEPITNAAQLRSIVGTLPIGTKLNLTALRNKERLNFNARIQDIPKDSLEDHKQLLSGVRLSNFVQLDPQLGSVKGVIVLQVDDSSNAWLAGLRPADVIMTANEQPAVDIDHLAKLASSSTDQLLLKIRRANGMIYIVIT
jgi:serine protease Do